MVIIAMLYVYGRHEAFCMNQWHYMESKDDLFSFRRLLLLQHGDHGAVYRAGNHCGKHQQNHEEQATSAHVAASGKASPLKRFL